MFCGEVEVVRAGNPHLLRAGEGGRFLEKWRSRGPATRTCLRAGGEGGGCVLWRRPWGGGGWVEVVQAGNPHKSGGAGVFCEEVEVVQAGIPHLLKSGGDGVFCGKSKPCGLAPAIA